MKIADARKEVASLIWDQTFGLSADRVFSKQTLDALRAVLKDSKRNEKKFKTKTAVIPKFMEGLQEFEGKPGEKIPVQFGSKVYETEIDENGTQRFLPIPGYEKYAEDFMIDGGPNNWVMQMYNGKLTKQEVFNRRIGGYSVSGFCDCYPSYKCINPLWE